MAGPVRSASALGGRAAARGDSGTRWSLVGNQAVSSRLPERPAGPIPKQTRRWRLLCPIKLGTEGTARRHGLDNHRGATTGRC